MDFQLREAEESDLDFIWQVRIVTMKDLIDRTYGWNEKVQLGYAKESLKGSIVLVDETPVGVVTLYDWGTQLHLVWLAIRPEYQRRGLATELIRHLQNRAASAGRPLTLQVLRDNPAVTLFEKMGFVVYSTEADRLLMRWSPETGEINGGGGDIEPKGHQPRKRIRREPQN